MEVKNEFRPIISDTLKKIGLHSNNAVELLLGTRAQESANGKYRRQLGNGPALGVFQMEPATFYDIVQNYLKYKKELFLKVLEVSGVPDYNPLYLIDNDVFAICMARIHYLRVREALPDNLDGWARYWKQYYNTPLGKGKVQEFVNNYKKYCV